MKNYCAKDYTARRCGSSSFTIIANIFVMIEFGYIAVSAQTLRKAWMLAGTVLSTSFHEAVLASSSTANHGWLGA
jgi:hypothetical protein